MNKTYTRHNTYARLFIDTGNGRTCFFIYRVRALPYLRVSLLVETSKIMYMKI